MGLFQSIIRGLKKRSQHTEGERPAMQPGEMGTHAELQKKYGLYAENRPEIQLDHGKVPEDLRDLIPMAEKWGIGDDVIRSDFQDKAGEEEKLALKRRLGGRGERINAWLDSFGDGAAMTEEAAAFMYMLLGIDEMGLWD
jgi:hypothetical protein